jgi:hypothetical protein
MPKLKCKCSYVIDLSPIPCLSEFILISDLDMETIFKSLEEDSNDTATLLEEKSKSVIVCSNCGRYHLSIPDSNAYVTLVPET